MMLNNFKFSYCTIWKDHMLCKLTDSQLIYSFLFLCLSDDVRGSPVSVTSCKTQLQHFLANSTFGSPTEIVSDKKNSVNSQNASQPNTNFNFSAC